MGQVKNKKAGKESSQNKSKKVESLKENKGEQKKKADIKKNIDKKVKKKQSVKTAKKKSVVVKKIRKRKIHFNRFQLDNKKNDDVFFVERIRVRGAKIKHYNFSLYPLDYDVISDDEIVLENEFEVEENLSVGIILFILFLCFGFGIGVGYLLYRVAINNSAIIIVSSLLG